MFIFTSSIARSRCCTQRKTHGLQTDGRNGFILIKIHFNLIIFLKMIKLSLTKNNLSLII